MPGKQGGKIFVVFTIFLLFGTWFIPVANHQSVQASTNEDFVSLTIEVTGKGNHTVRLRQEQYQNLLRYLDSFQEKIQTARSIDETRALYKQALQWFEERGFLPEDTNTQELYSRICRNLPRHSIAKTSSSGQHQRENFLCLVSGEASWLFCQNLMIHILFTFLYHIAEVRGSILEKWSNFLDNHPFLQKMFNIFVILLLPFAYTAEFIREIIAFLYEGSTVFLSIDPIAFTQILGLGNIGEVWPGEVVQTPSQGWLSTVGLHGFSYDNGSFIGALPILPFILASFAIYPGIFDFTGIKIVHDDPIIGNTFFLGSALWVKYNCTV